MNSLPITLETKDLVGLLLLPLATLAATLIMLFWPKLRALALFGIVAGLPASGLFDISIFSAYWYRGTTRGFEMTLFDIFALGLLFSSVLSPRANHPRVYWPASLGLMLLYLGYCAISTVGASPWIFGMFVVLAGGYLSQHFKAKGVSSRLCRGALACSTMMVGGCFLPFVGSMPSIELKIAFLVFGSAIGSTIYVVIPMIVSELTPQSQRAGMLAIVNSAVTLAGVIAPFAMGSVIQNAATPVAGYEKGYVVFGILLRIPL